MTVRAMAPDLLLDAMAECDVTATQTVMIGDTSFDMIMAKAAKPMLSALAGDIRRGRGG